MLPAEGTEVAGLVGYQKVSLVFGTAQSQSMIRLYSPHVKAGARAKCSQIFFLARVIEKCRKNGELDREMHDRNGRNVLYTQSQSMILLPCRWHSKPVELVTLSLSR